jgi:hypothetical protein
MWIFLVKVLPVKNPECDRKAMPILSERKADGAREELD